MPLDTQQFGITRYWLAAALANVPAVPDIFVVSKQLSQARKLFLAGKNQLAAIRNWLAAAGVIETAKGQVRLSELGQLMAAQDPRAEMALTWWLFHLHLCVNPDAFPYPIFFLLYDSEGRWMSYQVRKIRALLFHGLCRLGKIDWASESHQELDRCLSRTITASKNFND